MKMKNLYLLAVVILASIVGCLSQCAGKSEEDCCKDTLCAYANCTDGVQCINATDLVPEAKCEGTANICDGVTTESATLQDNDTTSQPEVTSMAPRSDNITLQPEPAAGTSSTENYNSSTSETDTGSTASATEPSGTTLEPSETTNATVTDESPTNGDNCSRSFDAWSFVGGMILVGGIILITFIGVKYYKSKTEQRYHQF